MIGAAKFPAHRLAPFTGVPLTAPFPLLWPPAPAPITLHSQALHTTCDFGGDYWFCNAFLLVASTPINGGEVMCFQRKSRVSTTWLSFPSETCPDACWPYCTTELLGSSPDYSRSVVPTPGSTYSFAYFPTVLSAMLLTELLSIRKSVADINKQNGGQTVKSASAV